MKTKTAFRRLLLLLCLGLVFFVSTPAYAKTTKTTKTTKTAKTEKAKKKIDVLVFAGQSNMMGHGDKSQAPKLTKNAGFAYLPVTAPGKISKLKEPFGRGQNDSYFNNIIDGKDFSTGSLVTAFVNAYYKQTKTPVLAVPAAANGTGSSSWATDRYKGVIKRTNAAVKAAEKKGYEVSHVYLVWLQGESDATAMQRNEDGTCDSGMTPTVYINNIKTMFGNIKEETDIKKCFVIQIPTYYGARTDPYDTNWRIYYEMIQQAQKKLCKNKDFILAGSITPGLDSSYIQEDGLHLTQKGLNKVGTEAGKNAGKYAKSH